MKDAQQLKFETRSTYPLMLANLKEISLYQENPLIQVNQLISKDSIINLWSDLVSLADTSILLNLENLLLIWYPSTNLII